MGHELQKMYYLEVDAYIGLMKNDAFHVCIRGLMPPGFAPQHAPRDHHFVRGLDPLAPRRDIGYLCKEAIRAGADCKWTMGHTPEADVTALQILYEQHARRFVTNHPLGRK